MIRSLKARLITLLLFPTAVILISVGVGGFFFARDIMLSEWQEGAILKLQRAAHHIDMELKAPVVWLGAFAQLGGILQEERFQKRMIEQIRRMNGVAAVNIHWMEKSALMREDLSRGVRITSPQYNPNVARETVSLLSNLLDDSGRAIGSVEIVFLFEHLIRDIKKLSWWQSSLACMVDEKGRYLAHTEAWMKERRSLGGTGDPLERAILDALKKGQSSGTVFGPGNPPGHVMGFYKIESAPWTIVLVAKGKDILGPVVRFEVYYSLIAALAVISVLFLIRTVAGGMARSVRTLSEAAERVAEGDYVNPLRIGTRDEIAQLTHSFNVMVEGLKERDFISMTFGRYVDPEVARKLLSRPEAVRLGGEEREVAILMSDIRGFTAVSQTLTPTQTIQLLNRFFSKIVEIVQAHNGIVVDFFGDGLLAFYDTLENPIEQSVRHAVNCGLKMQETMLGLNEENQIMGLPPIGIGIGVNAGKAVVGNMGSPRRTKYGVVGSAVNATERIQSAARAGEVIISQSVMDYLDNRVKIMNRFETTFKGMRDKKALYVLECGQSIQ